MSQRLGYREILALVMEALTKRGKGQYAELCEDVLGAAERKGLIPPSSPYGRGVVVAGAPKGAQLSHQEQERIREAVREAMWDCLLKRIIVFGMDQANGEWPFYRVTERGASSLGAGSLQPYDPDGFIDYFRKTAGSVDPTVDEYVLEAVRAFNAGCARSAAVMLGCASEKLLLLLADAFEAAISDPAKQAKYSKDLASKWMVSHKYSTLKNRLDLMVAAKKLPRDHAETVSGELPSGFELLRRCRNAAGHPDVPGNVDDDTVFLNLRTFVEYARRVSDLIAYFQGNAADW